MKTDWLPVIINKSKAGAGVCSPLKAELLLMFFMMNVINHSKNIKYGTVS